jgi:hypothetical protein
MSEKIIEELRERFCSGERGIEEFLLLQLVTNPQGLDINSILPLLLIGGGGFGRRGRSDKLALVAILIAQQQAQATAASSGTPAPASNMLPLLLALGLLGEEREVIYNRPWTKRDKDDDDADAVAH